MLGSGFYNFKILGNKYLPVYREGYTLIDYGNHGFMEFADNRIHPYVFYYIHEQLEPRLANDMESFDEVIAFGKQLRKLIVITRGDKGSVAINGNEIYECSSKKNQKIKIILIKYIKISEKQLVGLHF